MAKLVDAPSSGGGVRKDVLVRIQSRAQENLDPCQFRQGFFFLGIMTLLVDLNVTTKMKMLNTVLDENQARFAMTLGLESWKVLYYFLQQDGSLGVGSYYSGNCSTVLKLPESSSYKVDVKSTENELIDFVAQKTSFHVSGTIVSKNKEGNRYPLDNDVRSIAFNQIADAIHIKGGLYEQLRKL